MAPHLIIVCAIFFNVLTFNVNWHFHLFTYAITCFCFFFVVFWSRCTVLFQKMRNGTSYRTPLKTRKSGKFCQWGGKSKGWSNKKGVVKNNDKTNMNTSTIKIKTRPRIWVYFWLILDFLLHIAIKTGVTNC